MEPAKTIISKFAKPDEGLTGEAVISRITETAYTAPYRWQQPREKGGTGGLIPQRHHPRLLTYAKENGIELAPGDFLPRSEEVACTQ